MRILPIFASLALSMMLSACGEGASDEAPAIVNEIDPYLARALNDPLMVDPDLAYRNEGNAAITIGYDHALPSFKGSEASAGRAREEARLELLEQGVIEDLPLASQSAGPAILAQEFGVEAVLSAVNAPVECRKNVQGSFAYAAAMPDVVPIMPHGMVRVAAIVDQPECQLHLARYFTPAAVGDALQYHFTKLKRAGFEPAYYTQPEASLIADRRGTFVQIYARKTSGDLTAIDLISWKQP